MRLAGVSAHPLEDLEKWATEKFSLIKNFDVEIPNLNEIECYPEDRLGKLIKMVPVQDKNELKFYWTLPYYEREWHSKPLNYFSHLIGHEGENSLLSYLKSEGLALALSAGGDDEMNSFSSF